MPPCGNRCRFSESGICSSRVRPPLKIKLRLKFKTLRWRLLNSFSCYRDVFFRYRDFLIFFSVSTSSLTTYNLQDGEAQKSTLRLLPGRRGSRCWTTECRISMPIKRSRYQKGDLGHLDTTRKRHLNTEKRRTPKRLELCILPWTGKSCFSQDNFWGSEMPLNI